MNRHTFREWVGALERSAEDFVAQRPELAALDGAGLEAEECPEHGPECARVTYGCLRDHFGWAKADPAKVAATLLQTMIHE